MRKAGDVVFGWPMCARASQAVYLLKRTKTYVAAFLAFKFYIWFQCQLNLVSKCLSENTLVVSNFLMLTSVAGVQTKQIN